MRVVTVEEMREIERRAETEYGLTSPMLMEHAGRSVAEILREHAGGDRSRDLDVLVLVGPGNNGGDGRVMGRYLAGWGARVTSLSLERELRSDATATLPAGDPLENVREALASADIVADAFLGTGHARPLAPTMRQALALVQEERERRPRADRPRRGPAERAQRRHWRRRRRYHRRRSDRDARLPQDRAVPLPRRGARRRARGWDHRPARRDDDPARHGGA